MDDNTAEVLTQTLNATIQRYTQRSQNYEVEIANLTAENIALKMQLESLQPKESEATSDATPEVASISSKSKTTTS